MNMLKTTLVATAIATSATAMATETTTASFLKAQASQVK